VKVFSLRRAFGAGLSLLLALQPLSVLAVEESRGPINAGITRPVIGATTPTGHSLSVPAIQTTLDLNTAVAPPANVSNALEPSAEAATPQALNATPVLPSSVVQEAVPTPVVDAPAAENSGTPAGSFGKKDGSEKRDPVSERVLGEAEARGWSQGTQTEPTTGAESTNSTLDAADAHETPRSQVPSPRESLLPTRAFLSSLLVAQIGVEIMGLAIPRAPRFWRPSRSRR
jgi:hypothetical protein